jgi:hypothetical protein
MNEPFAILGISPTRDSRLVSGGSLEEPRAKKPVTTPPPPGPVRERFLCPRCDDTFPVDDTCPRCEEVVVDTWRGQRVTVLDDPRIAKLIAMLERGPRFQPPDIPIPDAARPFVASLLFLGGAYMTASIGLPVLGVMLGGFGLAIAALEVHERATRSARVRLFIF